MRRLSALATLLLLAATGCSDHHAEPRHVPPLLFGVGTGSTVDGGSGGVGPPMMRTGEACGNGIDDDGNGLIDEGCTCSIGETQRCYGGREEFAGIGVCALGEQPCIDVGGNHPVWGACTGWVSSRPESLNGLDDDCNGLVDEGLPCLSSDLDAGMPSPDGATMDAVESESAVAGGDVPEASMDAMGDARREVTLNGSICYHGAPSTLGYGACRAGAPVCVLS